MEKEIDWNSYYTNPENIEKIAKFCRYREVVAIKRLKDRNVTLRPLKIFKPEHFEYWFNRTLKDCLFDLYISNASVKLPPLPPGLSNLEEARRIVNEKWRKYLQQEETDFVTGFDLFADIDIDAMEQRDDARRYALKLWEELRKLKLKPQLWDTSRGFHVIVLGRFDPMDCFALLRDICNKAKIPTSMSRICERCGNLYIADKCPECGSTKCKVAEKPRVDLAVSLDIRRIRRCPYSLHSKTHKPMVRIC